MEKLYPTLALAVVVLLVVSPTAQPEIKRTPKGGYIVAGLTTLDREGHDIGLIKLDEEESIEWQKAYGKKSWDTWGPAGAALIDLTEDGGFIYVGGTQTSNSYPRPSQSHLLRLDQDGNLIWQKELRRDDYKCDLMSVTRTEDDGYIVAGGVGPVPPKETKNADMDAWVVKVNQDGSVAWQYTYGGDSIDWANHIIQTEDGGYLFVGETTEPSGQQSAGDLWAVKLDETGSIEWQKSYGEPYKMETLGVEIGWAAIQIENSDYLVVGTTRSFGEGGGARCSIWILRLDNRGNIKWQKAYGGESLDHATIIIESISGGYLIGGSTSSFAPWKDFSITEDDLPAHQNMWLFEIDKGGRIVWQKVYGTDQSDVPTSIAQTTKEGYFVKGLVSKQPRIFKIGEKGTPLGELDELNVDPTDVTAKNTTTEPAETSVSPKPIEVNILDLDLQVNETDISDIFLSEN
ncbi:hypothetical protein KGY77_09795 [Candidatus Bipolaricaulota bacterium]|nr:hypothetical protein [Candidatus Bipolaricaulota bacterium]